MSIITLSKFPKVTFYGLSFLSFSNPPQTIRNKRLKILYSTQAAAHPPMFLLFANNEDLIKEHYKRYLENKLREAFGFFGTPIRISVRTRSEKAKKK